MTAASFEVVPSKAHEGEFVVVRKGQRPGVRTLDGRLTDTGIVAAGRWTEAEAWAWVAEYVQRTSSTGAAK